MSRKENTQIHTQAAPDLAFVDETVEAMERAMIELGAPAIVKEVGFTGMSYLTPLVEVVPASTPLHKRVEKGQGVRGGVA